MILVKNLVNDIGVSVSEFVEYNNDSTKEAEVLFQVFKSKSILKDCEFIDSEWFVFNGLDKIMLKFHISEIQYVRECKRRKMYNYEEFLNSIKSYVVLKLNDRSAQGMAVCLNKLNKFLESTKYLNLDYIENRFEKFNIGISNTYATEVAFISDFLNYIEYPGVVKYREVLTKDLERLGELSASYKSSIADNRRELADFQSVFLLDKVFEEFWVNSSSEKEKMLYFPLYIWWRLTNILPLRIKEFLVTPYECINRDDDGNYTITVRRSNLKGFKGKKVKHDINKDFRFSTYPIPGGIAKLILDYKDKSSNFRSESEQELLFSSKMFIEMALGDKNYTKKFHLENTDIFTKSSLICMLDRFYIEIIQNRNGIKIKDATQVRSHRLKREKVEDTSTPLGYKEMNIIRLGDTRHFAMINMVLNDVSPILVKDFAGHMDINTSNHYYGNISELVKCISYNKYKELCEYDSEEVFNKEGGVNANQLLNSLDTEDRNSIAMDNGLCTSNKFAKGKLEDCVEVDADCNVCDFFIRKSKETKEMRIAKMKSMENEIRREGELLGTLLAACKSDGRNDSAIVQSMTKLQSKSARYIKDVSENGGYYE